MKKKSEITLLPLRAAVSECLFQLSIRWRENERNEGILIFFFFPAKTERERLDPLHQRADSLHSDGAVELTYPPTRPLACSESFQPLLLLIDNETAINKIKEGGVNHSQDVTPRIGTKTHCDPLEQRLYSTWCSQRSPPPPPAATT